jgi:Flp pilus assembly protein TadG
MTKMVKDKKDERGASAIEFAIVLPVLVALLFGIIELSILFYDKAVITNAGREGARAGIAFAPTPLDDAGIAGVVNTYCASNLITFGSATAAATAVSRGGSGTAGDPLTVTVNYPYEFLVLPNFVTALTGPVNLQAVTVMRME